MFDLFFLYFHSFYFLVNIGDCRLVYKSVSYDLAMTMVMMIVTNKWHDLVTVTFWWAIWFYCLKYIIVLILCAFNFIHLFIFFNFRWLLLFIMTVVTHVLLLIWFWIVVIFFVLLKTVTIKFNKWVFICICQVRCIRNK